MRSHPSRVAPLLGFRTMATTGTLAHVRLDRHRAIVIEVVVVHANSTDPHADVTIIRYSEQGVVLLDCKLRTAFRAVLVHECITL